MASATLEAERAPESIDPASILGTLPHPVVALDREDRVAFANVPAQSFFQAGAAVLRRNRLADLVPFGSPVLSLVAQVRERLASVSEYGVDLGTPKIGGQRLADIQVAPILEQPGHILILFQERTMAHKIDRQLTHRGAARSVAGMAAILAHEIKNPLSGIRGAAQLLESSVEDEDRSLTKLICEETDRICKLVDRMEVFNDNRPIEAEPQNIHAILDRVREIAVNGFAREIEISETYDPSLPPVLGDRDQLIQVFLNLVKNACEAVASVRGHNGQVVLSTAFRPGVRLSVPGTGRRIGLPLEICVRDNGPGVPDDIREHMFDPFVTTKSFGTGLGLALVAKIVGNHGGIIECESGPPQTTFRVLLPMHMESAAHPAGETGE